MEVELTCEKLWTEVSHISAVLVKYLRIAVDAAKEQPPHDEFVVMCRNYRGGSSFVANSHLFTTASFRLGFPIKQTLVCLVFDHSRTARRS